MNERGRVRTPIKMIEEFNPQRGPLEIAIHVRCDQWRQDLPDAEKVCRAAAGAVWASQGFTDGEAELSLLLADDALLRELNRDYRNLDKPTNVLSFPQGEGGAIPSGGHLLGDVVLAFETIAREAMEQGKDLSDHTSHLVVHGVLHLLGYKHLRYSEAEEMEKLERRILATLDVADPYTAAEIRIST